MSTFECHCGGTITGVSAPDTERDNQPNWTFTCDDHLETVDRVLLIVKVSGTPDAEETRMGLMQEQINHNTQWYVDNPDPDLDHLTAILDLTAAAPL